jgi:DNA repair exonuclease SbcCD ATPase subunit
MSDDMQLGDEDGAEDEPDLTLEEILAELEEEENKMEEAAKVPGNIQTAGAYDVSQVEEMKKELNEAIKTIKHLKAELNETNLFSAKMLYVNKIFKAKNLTEAQKKKVIDAFDRNTTVKEVENTYKTLLESVSDSSKKTPLRESVGFASKPIGSAPAKPIVEADAFVTRWQQLAGIKK